MIQLQWEAVSRLREPNVEGEVRFGTPEDFATHYLPDVLANFRQQHPRVQLRVECDLTLNLIDGFHRGEFDMILVKRDLQLVRGARRSGGNRWSGLPPTAINHRSVCRWCYLRSPVFTVLAL